MLDMLGVPSTVSPLRRRRPRRAGRREHRAGRRPAGRRWRCPGGPGRPCSTCSTRTGPPRWRSACASVGGAVAGGLDVLFWQATAAGGADDGAAGADRCDARRARRRRGPPLTPDRWTSSRCPSAAAPGRVSSLLVAVVLGPWLARVAVRLATPGRRRAAVRGCAVAVTVVRARRRCSRGRCCSPASAPPRSRYAWAARRGGGPRARWTCSCTGCPTGSPSRLRRLRRRLHRRRRRARRVGVAAAGAGGRRRRVRRGGRRRGGRRRRAWASVTSSCSGCSAWCWAGPAGASS